MTDNDKTNSNNINDNNNNFVKKSKKMILVDEKEPVGELPPPFPPRNIEVNDNDDIRDFYDLKKEIGRGRFGTVYLVEDKKTGQKFAAKFVNTKRNQDRANVEREVEIMKLLNAEKPHPRLIQLYDAYDMAKEICLVLEIVDGGELFERVINDDFVLTERACTVFLRQICEGVEFIHSKNILHLDMKPENILCLSREGNRVKICDFGLARRYDPRKKLQVLFGTPEFVAPEVVNFEPIGFGTDMWSVGVICYVLLSGLSPFMGHNYVETMTNVTHNKYDFDDEAFEMVSEEAKEFIQKLLVLDKSMRLTPAQCLHHNWLRTPPPPKYLLRRFPSSASNSSEDASDEEDDEEEEDEEEEEEEEVIQEMRQEEEEEKYSVRRRRRKEEEENARRKKEDEVEEEVKRKELEMQIDEKKKRIEEEEERCMRKREVEEVKRKEEEARRRKSEEEEERSKEEEELRRKREEEEARRKKEEEEGRKRKRKEEEVRRKEQEAERRRKEEEERRRAEEEKRKKEEEKRKEAGEKMRKEVEEKRKKEMEENRRKEVEKRREAEARDKKEAEERLKKQQEEKKKEEEEMKKWEGKERRRRPERREREGVGVGVGVDGELGRSKAQLRDFVVRWSAHPNSPYVVVAEDAPRGLEATRTCSGASLTSLAVVPPNDTNPDDLNDEDEDEEFVHYTISAPLKGPASPGDVARNLEARLKQLPGPEVTEDGRNGGKGGARSSRKGGARANKRPSPARSSHSRVLHESEQAETIIREILRVDHRSAYEEYQRMVAAAGGGGAPLRRPEVVALQQEEGGATRPSRGASPTKQPRRQPSRDVPRDDRPPSREGERSSALAYRRPSRDVPLNAAQMERLAKAAAGGGSVPQAWPDLIVAPQDEADEEVRQFSLDVPVASLLKSPSGTLHSVPGLKVSPEPERDAAPAPTPTPAPKSAPPLTPPPSPSSDKSKKPVLSPPPSPVPAHKGISTLTPSSSLASTNDSKPALTPPPSPTPQKDPALSEDAPSRLVAWILDIGSRTPPRQNSTGSLQDRVSHWEARDGRPRPSPSPSPSPRLSPSPRPSPSPSPSRRPSDRSPLPAGGSRNEAAPPRRTQPSFNALPSEKSSTEKVIHTPWGALKRSPSRSSFTKSPPREREASPAGRGKAGSPTRKAPEAGQVPVPGTSSPARSQKGVCGWAAGNKSHTLPRSAKLMRQRSMGSVPAANGTSQPEADGGLKRKSKFPPSPNKRPLAPLLFSAQDRISMFEQQQPTERGYPPPLARTRSSVTLGATASTDPRASDRSQVGFMKSRLLSKVGRGAGPTVPEEPTSPDTGRLPGPDAA